MAAVAAMTPLLMTKGLSRTFGGLKAVDSVDFSLAEGEIRAVIGPNGAGKTTLVSLVCGRIPASKGSVIFDGRDISRLPAYRRVRLGIAYTFQITSIFSGLTVFDNVALAAERRLLNTRGRRPTAHALKAAASTALDMVGLAAYAGRRAGELSYGHQRLVEVAMGLALEPRLLILDEPTQGLSDGEIENFIALVQRIGRTVLLIEHNMDVVMALAERITVMDQGRILAEGTAKEIRANRAVQEAYLGSAA